MRIQLTDLTKKFPDCLALDRINLDLPEGEVIALVGMNGAGKSTLLNLLAGILAPTSGSIAYDGETFFRSKLPLRKKFYFLPDLPPIQGDSTILEHIAVVLRAYDLELTKNLENRILQTLEELDLLPLAGRSWLALSRGQVYKAALTALIAVRPELWLLDEPFAAGVDPRGLAIMKSNIREASQQGATILYTTQILEVVSTFADRMIILDEGRIRQVMTRNEWENLPREGSGGLEDLLGIYREPVKPA